MLAPGCLARKSIQDDAWFGELEGDLVRALRRGVVVGAFEHPPGGLLEAEREGVAALGESLAGAQLERHAGPALVVDQHLERGERLDRGVRRYAGLCAVTVVLAEDRPGRVKWLDRIKHLSGRFAEALGVEPIRWFHGDEPQDVQQVGNDHVAKRAGLLKEPGAALDRQLLGHVNLDVVDVTAVPDRLKQAVGEAEGEDVLDGLLAEEVVDAKDLGLIEHARATSG